MLVSSGEGAELACRAVITITVTVIVVIIIEQAFHGARVCMRTASVFVREENIQESVCCAAAAAAVFFARKRKNTTRMHECDTRAYLYLFVVALCRISAVNNVTFGTCAFANWDSLEITIAGISPRPHLHNIYALRLIVFSNNFKSGFCCC